MKEFNGQVNKSCAYLDLENYTCGRVNEDYVPINSMCQGCLAELYYLWKEAIWERAKERSLRSFPTFGVHG